MKQKCTKFEGLFVFSDENRLREHINSCEDCKKQTENFDKLSNLIQEAKPLYFKKQNLIKRRFKTACAMFLLVLSVSVFSVLNYGSNIAETLKYGQTLCAEDYGFPVDSYGLIMVDE